MSGTLPQLLLVAVLVVINAAFAGTELALVSLRESQLKRLEQSSATGVTYASPAPGTSSARIVSSAYWARAEPASSIWPSATTGRSASASR